MLFSLNIIHKMTSNKGSKQAFFFPEGLHHYTVGMLEDWHAK